MHSVGFQLSRGVHLARAKDISLPTDVLYLVNYASQNVVIWYQDTFTHIVVIACEFDSIGVRTCTCAMFPIICKGIF